MKFRQAGFFRELRDGNPNGPSIIASRGKLPQELRPLAAKYLRSGSTIVIALGSDVDWFDGTFRVPLEVKTDGEWIWPGHYAYYIEKYGVDVPQDFLHHMAKKDWFEPEMPEDEIMKIADSDFLLIEDE
jgi:hypothetical protein